ncbi:MAG: hypothetical protein ACK50J_02515, partial [Planctomyces sp.]
MPTVEAAQQELRPPCYPDDARLEPDCSFCRTFRPQISEPQPLSVLFFEHGIDGDGRCQQKRSQSGSWFPL